MRQHVVWTVLGGAAVGAVVAVLVLPRAPADDGAADAPVLLVAPSRAAPATAPASPAVVPPALAPPAVVPPAVVRTLPAAHAAPAARDAAPIDPCSQVAVQERLRHGWSLVRDDPMPLELVERSLHDYYDALMTLPVDTARALGERQTRRDAWLDRLDDEPLLELTRRLHGEDIGPLVELAGDGPRFSALLGRRTPEQLVAYDEFVRGRASASDGTTLRLTQGITRLGPWYPIGMRVPEDLSLVGAGMDRTLLVLDDPALRNPAVRLRVADCTVLVRSSLLQTEGQGASLVLDRVRVVGLPDASGKVALFDRGIALVLLARDSVFEAGDASAAHSPSLMRSVNASTLARFERCEFRGVRLDVRSIHPESTLVFEGCRFLDLPVDVSAALDRREGLVLRDSALALAVPGGPPARAPSTLDRLFPGWQAER